MIRLTVSESERLNMMKFFIAISGLHKICKPNIDLPKLRSAYQAIKFKVVVR